MLAVSVSVARSRPTAFSGYISGPGYRRTGKIPEPEENPSEYLQGTCVTVRALKNVSSTNLCEIVRAITTNTLLVHDAIEVGVPSRRLNYYIL